MRDEGLREVSDYSDCTIEETTRKEKYRGEFMGLLEKFITEETIFTQQRDVLRPSYIPERMLHRDEQLNKVAAILSASPLGFGSFCTFA